MNKLFLGLIIIFLAACSAQVSTSITKSLPPLDYKEEVTVIGISGEVPASATELGTIKIGDSGFSTDCGWDVVIEKAKMEARKAGGNVVKIIEHIPPSIWGSSCDRITAKILKVDSLQEINHMKASNSAIIDSTWQYAKLYVYRPSGVGPIVGYDLYLGDSVICRMKNNSKYELIITKKGMNTLWAKTEAKAEVPINIEYGREYYLKCTLSMGFMVGHPQLQLVDHTEGKSEYNATKSK